MSNSYPNYHTHTENGKRGDKGQKGVGGEKGDTGLNGHITEILFAFTNKTPADLFENTFPADWDAPGAPLKTLSVRPGQSFVYTVDNSIWTYLPQANTAGWLQTGTVVGDIYTVPGEKGIPGDVGSKGEVGEKGNIGAEGEKGIPGSVAAKGEDGETGEKGARGEKGEKGHRGLIGLKGEEGGKGETGQKGDDGLAGADGSDGSDGTDGSDGQKGEPGEEGITPGIETVPVMIVSYNGTNDLLLNQYNLDTVTKLDTGYYRFRLKDKTIGGVNSVSVVTAVNLTGLPVSSYITRQTGRVVEIKTCNLIGSPLDATVNVVMYNPG